MSLSNYIITRLRLEKNPSIDKIKCIFYSPFTFSVHLEYSVFDSFCFFILIAFFISFITNFYFLTTLSAAFTRLIWLLLVIRICIIVNTYLTLSFPMRLEIKNLSKNNVCWLSGYLHYLKVYNFKLIIGTQLLN